MRARDGTTATAGGIRSLADNRLYSVRAASGDAAWLDRLARDGFRGRVHSAFDRTVHVIDPEGALYTLASRSIDDAPGTLVVDIAGFDDTLAEGLPVTAIGSTLFVGCLAVELARARRWRCRLPAYPCSSAVPRQNLPVLDAALQIRRGNGIDASRGASPAVDDAVAAALIRHRAAVVDAIVRLDPAGLRKSARALVGFGPDLTPSGDDFLVGLFAVLNVEGSPARSLQSVCAEIAAAARPLTHAISYAALAHAAQGQVRESIARLLYAALHDTRPAAVAALSRVLAIGSTSGSDIAAGVVAGLSAGLQLEAVQAAGAAR